MGNKAYVEFRGEATQLNGKPYNNQYLWIMIFDDQGHAQEIREYLDTRLVQEVFTNNWTSGNLTWVPLSEDADGVLSDGFVAIVVGCYTWYLRIFLHAKNSHRLSMPERGIVYAVKYTII